MRALWDAALDTCHTLFPWGIRDNATEVIGWLCDMPSCFHDAVEDGVWQGTASALVVVHFRFCHLVDVHEVAAGYLGCVTKEEVSALIPMLEGATDAVLAIAPLEAILRGPSPSREG